MKTVIFLIVLWLNFVLYASEVVSAQHDQQEVFFHQFAVGQGNCQLFIYPVGDKKIGFLYDAGSSDGTLHKKFIQLRSGGIETILLETTGSSAPVSSDTVQRRVDLPPPEDTTSRSSSESDGIRSIGDGADKDKRSILEQNRGEVSAIISNSNLSYLFIFLSHPDGDHISFFKDKSDNFLPKNLKTHFILSGDWLGEAGGNTLGDDLSEPVIGVFNFISSRKSTATFSLPYYWDEADYNSIKEKFSERRRERDDEDWHSRNLYDRFKNKPFTASVKTVKPFEGNFRILLEKLKFVGDITQEDNFIKELDIEGIYGNPFDLVNIWSLNNFSDDPNNQSMIVSFTFSGVPDMSFVSTGDAHNSVFTRIKGDSDILRKCISARENHLVFCTLPHHGSAENTSFYMWNLFRPNAFIIPAGTYARHGHPSFSLMQQIMNPPDASEAKSLVEKFQERFKPVDKNNPSWFVAFTKEKKGGKTTKSARVVYMHSSAILCPNVQGTIFMQVNERKVDIRSSPAKMLIERGGQTFLVDYRKRFAEIGKNQASKSQDTISIENLTYRLLENKEDSDESFADLFVASSANMSPDNDKNYLWLLDDRLIYKAELVE